MSRNRPSWMVVSWSLALCATMIACPARAATRLVLAVGQDRGASDQVDLRFAEQEAEAFAELMSRAGLTTPDDVQLLTGASPASLDIALFQLGARAGELRAAGERVEIVIFVSGHARQGALWLDGEPYSLTALRHAIEEIDADVVVAFLDACHAGGLLRAKGATAIGGYEMEVTSVGGIGGRVLITSSGSNELAYESDELGGSLFGRNLLAGLRGAADREGDGLVTLDETYVYLYSRTLEDSLALAGVPQHAVVDADLQGAGEIVLTELDRAQATLTLEPAGDARLIWVIDVSRDRVLAELAVAPRQQVRLAVKAGRLAVYQRTDEAARVAHLQVEPGEERSLAPDGGRLALARPLRARGGELLTRRTDLVGGYALSSPWLAGGAWLSTGWLALGAQASPLLRVGVSARVGGGSFAAVDVHVHQVEFGLDGGVWLSPYRKLQPLIGLRAGGGVMTQIAQWNDPGGWYDIEPADLPVQHSGTIRALVEGGVLWRPGRRFVLRATVAGGLAVVPGELGPRSSAVGELRLGCGGTL